MSAGRASDGGRASSRRSPEAASVTVSSSSRSRMTSALRSSRIGAAGGDVVDFELGDPRREPADLGLQRTCGAAALAVLAHLGLGSGLDLRLGPP